MSESLAPHIIFICSRLDLPGGIERAIVNTANLFIENGNEVTILVADITPASFYPLSGKVRVIQKELSFGINGHGHVVGKKTRLVKDILRLRKILRQLAPGLVIATEYPFAVAAVMARSPHKLISWEHHHFYELKKSWFWGKISRYAYGKLDAIVCLNEDEKKLFSAQNKNVFVIPNFIKPDKPNAPSENKNIITVARLTAVKGIDLLLTVAKKVLTRYTDHTWTLIGDGEMKQMVLDFIQKENLQGRFILKTPLDHHIYHHYQSAYLYVMTSRNECFPMVLLEAQACGLPCIAFDCETGPRHIITHNVNGLLVEMQHTDALAIAISSLIDDEQRRHAMAIKAADDVKRFSPGNIYRLWKDYFFLQ